MNDNARKAALKIASQDVLVRYLGQLLTSNVDTAAWRIGREFVMLDYVERRKLIHDIMDTYGTGDSEYRIARTLRDMLDHVTVITEKPEEK